MPETVGFLAELYCIALVIHRFHGDVVRYAGYNNTIIRIVSAIGNRPIIN